MEIAEDLTYYFANSEQVPSSVGLGVLMDKDNTVRQAGGFIIQLMPFVEDGVVDKLEQKLNSIDSVTSYLDRGFTPSSCSQRSWVSSVWRSMTRWMHSSTATAAGNVWKRR